MANSYQNHTSASDKETKEKKLEKLHLIFDNQKTFYVGKPVDFHFSTRSDDLSQMKINVLGPSRCKIKHYTIRDGLYGVSFVPLNPGSYMIIVKWTGMEIPESPIICHVKESENIFQRRSLLRRASLSVPSRLFAVVPGSVPLPRKFRN